MRLTVYKKHKLSLLLRLTVYLSAAVSVAVALLIVGYVVVNGVPNLKPSLFSLNYTSENHSMLPALINTVVIIALTLAIALPLGVFSAIFLTEYASGTQGFVRVIRITAETLSGIPSIVYGLFGFLIFVTTFRLGYSLLSGALTLAIMVLPTLMRTTEEALLAVPKDYREGAYGLGAGKLRILTKIVLPAAFSDIISGVVLCVGRIIGETAALIYTAGTVAVLSENIMGSGRTLSVHMYSLLTEGLYTREAYGVAVVLLALAVLTSFATKRKEDKSEQHKS